MSKEQLDFILEISAQNPPPENATLDMMFEWSEAINAQTPIADGSMIERISAGPCSGDLIRREDTSSNQLVIFYHGGGFFFGSSRSRRVIATHLARTSGATVLAADYRLAPENAAPAAHDDAFSVYEWAVSQGYAPTSIALAGDSAGGNLALSVAVRAKKQGFPLPAALVLVAGARPCERRRVSLHDNRCPAFDAATDGLLQRDLYRDRRPQVRARHALLQ